MHFHYLQAWWSWLWDKKHGIDKGDRQPIIQVIRSMVYAQSESELLQYYNNIMKQDPHAYTTKYPQLAKHIQQFWDKRTEWGLWFRLDKMTRGNNTNKYAEAGIRVLKEIIFGRVKAYNLIQMFQFITITMEALSYFKNRLLNIDFVPVWL